MAIRPANTVSIIRRRLGQAEGESVAPEPMELVSLHDELSRQERKWAQQLAAGSERRKPADLETLNGFYRRLSLLIERTLRAGKADSDTEKLLRDALARCAPRSARIGDGA